MGLYVLHVTPLLILTLIFTNKSYINVGEKRLSENKFSSMFFQHGDQVCETK